MKTLHISVADKIATYQARDGEIVCGNSGYQIKFTFDSEWESHAQKTARFIWNGQYFDVDFTGDTCDVPIVQKTSELKVGVYAGDLVTTTPAKIGCRASILCGSEPPNPGTGHHYSNEAKASAEAAKVSETNAKSSETKAKTSENNAKSSATTASTKANEAKSSADQASASAAEASGYLDETKDIFRNFDSWDSRITRNDKRITNLEKGLIPDPFVTDDSITYAKPVPDGALPYAEITKIGGMTHRHIATNTFNESKVTTVKSVTSKNILPIPYNFSTTTIKGVRFTANEDGSISVSGTATASGELELIKTPIDIKDSITICGVNGGSVATFYMQPSFDEEYAAAITDGSVTYDKVGTSLTRLTFFFKSGAAIDTKLFPMVYYSFNGYLDYVPYHEETLTIPAAVQGVEGYGCGVNEKYNNSVVWEAEANKRLFKRKTKRKIFDGTENLVSWTNGTTFIGVTFDGVDYDFSRGNDVRGICSHFDILVGGQIVNSALCFRQAGDYQRFYFVDSTITSLEDWKTFFATKYADGNPVIVEYGIAEEEVSDISDLITVDNMIKVEPYGTLTFENEYGYAVPSEVTYQIKGEPA